MEDKNNFLFGDKSVVCSILTPRFNDLLSEMVCKPEVCN